MFEFHAAMDRFDAFMEAHETEEAIFVFMIVSIFGAIAIYDHLTKKEMK